MIREVEKSSVRRKVGETILYVIACGGIGYFALVLMNGHVSTHPVPSAFGYEYLVVLIPFLIAFATFPFWPLIVYAISRGLFRLDRTHLISLPVLVPSTIAYGVSLLVTGIFFTWARQQ